MSFYDRTLYDTLTEDLNQNNCFSVLGPQKRRVFSGKLNNVLHLLELHSVVLHLLDLHHLSLFLLLNL